jgi:hypothetical protein
MVATSSLPPQAPTLMASGHKYFSPLLLDHVVIRHQPEELLARLLFAACGAMQAHGVTMTIGTFAELMDVNAANRESWMPITTTFRPHEGGASEHNGIVVMGRDHTGRVVTTQAVRLFDWRNSHLKTEAEALRLFYADPAPAPEAGEECFVKDPSASEISGMCAYIGGLWCHPDYRGRGRVRLITGIGRATALATWGFDHLVGLITPTNLQRNFHGRTGHTTVAPKSVIMRNSPSLPGGDLEMTIVHMTALQLVDDLFKLLLDLQTQVDAGLEARRA